MEMPLLQTKLHIPQPQTTDLVPRPALMARLNQSLRGKLTLVAAPPGFGKTTLVSQWLHELQANESHRAYRPAWLSLDEK